MPTHRSLKRSVTFVVLLCSGLLGSVSRLDAEAIPAALMGDWSLDLESKQPAWMSIGEEDGHPVASFRIYVGSAGPYPIGEVVDGRVRFALKRKNISKQSDVVVETNVDVGLTDGKLDGVIVRSFSDASDDKRIRFTGKKIPPMPKAKPDLSKVNFGQPVALFNGKDLSGWRTHEDDKINGWSVKDGMLVNTTPKTDFSATGAYANLRTVAEFEDFWLHAEFLVGAQRNSGIYLRGMYEAQVVDRDSRMQGIIGVGSIFGAIAPKTNAGRPGGEWQTYDLTLVDRHVTVILNGVKVIDNQPIAAPTAGAIYTDPAAPGPIYLQGDHTAVKYKHIYLAPVRNSH